MNAKTASSSQTKKNARTTLAALAREADGLLRELRLMPRTRRFRDRRAWVQRRIAEIGAEMRQTLGIRI